MANSPDWLGLERKISQGKLLEQAAEEMGIPLEDAKNHVLGRRSGGEGADDAGLHLTAAYAIQTAVAKLAKLAEGDVRESNKTVFGAESTSYESTDLKAAQELLKAGIQLKKMLRPRQVQGKPGSPAAGGDLFDGTSPWKFKAPE